MKYENKFYQKKMNLRKNTFSITTRQIGQFF